MKFGWTTSRAIILFQFSLTILLCPLYCCYGYHSRSLPFALDKKDAKTTTRGPIRSCISPYYSGNNQDNRHRITERKSKQRTRSSVCCSFAFVNDVNNNDDNDYYYDDDDQKIKAISILGQEKMERIQNMVIQRAKNRWEGRYDIADKIRDEIQNNITLPNGYEISIQDIPRKDGGGSTWNLVLQKQQHTTNSSSGNFIEEGPTVLQLAHSALGLAVEQSIQYNLRRTQASLLLLPQIDDDVDDDISYYSPSSDDDDDSFFSFYRQQLDTIVQQAKERMSKFSYYTQQQELAGRKAADAAFWFAIAGVTDQQLFTKLIQISIHELQRFGERPSCRPKDIYQILERFAAAGIVSVIDDTANNASSSHDINIIDDKDDDICTYCTKLEEVAERILKYKNNNQQEQSTTDDRSDGIGGLLDLHSNRSLLLLWKFSTKQKKQKAFLKSAHKHWEREKYHRRDIENGKENNNSNNNNNSNCGSHSVLPTKSSTTTTNSTAKIQTSISNKYNWDTIFSDPSRPLVIDIGCGMGVSLLGLAKVSMRTRNNVEQQQRQHRQHDDDCYFFSSDPLLNKHTKWSDCNFAGVDLGALGIGYANGVSKRIGLSSRLHYFVDSAEDFVEHIQTTYPGPVLLCLVQFPTPFRLQKGNDMQQQQQQQGNLQLPDSAEDGFMVSKDLLRSIRKVLSSSSSSSSTTTTTTGQLLIQSNCEDVAVWMRNMACKTCDFDYANFPVEVVAKDNLLMTATTKVRQPQRTVDWIAMGGERASGPGWLHSPILPRSASTETEVACSLNGTPVHRCLLRPKFR